jgi:hypothetical protein
MTSCSACASGRYAPSGSASCYLPYQVCEQLAGSPSTTQRFSLSTFTLDYVANIPASVGKQCRPANGSACLQSLFCNASALCFLNDTDQPEVQSTVDLTPVTFTVLVSRDATQLRLQIGGTPAVPQYCPPATGYAVVVEAKGSGECPPKPLTPVGISLARPGDGSAFNRAVPGLGEGNEYCLYLQVTGRLCVSSCC